MPDDLPVEPARPAVTATASPHAWERGARLWTAYFAIGYVGVAGLVWLGGDPLPNRIAAVALLAAQALWYALYGRRVMARNDEGPAAYVFIGGMIVLFAPMGWLVGVGSFVLIVLCPQCFMTLRTPWAVVAVILLNLTPAVKILGDTESVAAKLSVVLVGVVIVAFSVLFGTWSDRIITQSGERAALIERLEESQEEVARLSRDTGTMAERERLAAEIHDTLAQGFTSLLMLIQATESELERDPAAARHHLDLAARTARENLDEARALVAALRPTALASTSLDQALRRMVHRLGDELGVTAAYEPDGTAPLDPAAEVVLLRATQEALANVRKHARAGRVTVRLERGDDRTVLTVSDDGAGFDPSGTPEDSGADGGYGLAGMRARVRQVGGTLTVRSASGKGTDVVVTVGSADNPADNPAGEPA